MLAATLPAHPALLHGHRIHKLLLFLLPATLYQEFLDAILALLKLTVPWVLQLTQTIAVRLRLLLQPVLTEPLQAMAVHAPRQEHGL